MDRPRGDPATALTTPMSLPDESVAARTSLPRHGGEDWPPPRRSWAIVGCPASATSSDCGSHASEVKGRPWPNPIGCPLRQSVQWIRVRLQW